MLLNGSLSPAQQVGLRVGDILVSVNGLDVWGNFNQARNKPRSEVVIPSVDFLVPVPNDRWIESSWCHVTVLTPSGYEYRVTES